MTTATEVGTSIWEVRVQHSDFTPENQHATWIWVLSQDGSHVVRINYVRGSNSDDMMVDAATLRRGLAELDRPHKGEFVLRELNDMPLNAADKVVHWLALAKALFLADPVKEVGNDQTTIVASRNYDQTLWLLVKHHGAGTTNEFFVADTELNAAIQQLAQIANVGYLMSPVKLTGFHGLMLTAQNWREYYEMLSGISQLLA